MPDGLAAMLSSLTGVEHPVSAIVVSRESQSYRAELDWVARAMTERGNATFACAPEEIVFTEDALLRPAAGRPRREGRRALPQFELFDLLNVPKRELMLYAARHNRVKLTPPVKAHLEEKSVVRTAAQSGAGANAWRKNSATRRSSACARSFRNVGTRSAPAAAASGRSRPEPRASRCTDWMQLSTLGKSERDYVVKPSGFSELAWGSRGVNIANDLT